MRSKAVSPLVAAVLLIAVTMTIAGMLAYWASGFVRLQTETFSNQSIVSKCNFADFKVYSCSYNSTSQRINLILENIRSIELHNLTAFVVYPDNTVSRFDLNGSLPSGFIKSFPISPVSSGYSSMNIKTECPELSVSATCK
jgi:flagellin-like protein